MEKLDIDEQPGEAAGGRFDFPPTHWALVLASGETNCAEAAPALERLCRSYWHPLYAFVRRRGWSPQEAEDLTQSFFAHVFENDALKKVDRERGKFRTFLMAAMTNFLNNEWDKRQAGKRGGGHKIISWDEVSAEERYHSEPVDLFTPEKIFERRWAMTLAESALARLERECAAGEKGALFKKLQPHLTSEPESGFYACTAPELQMSEGALRVALHRLRRRFGEMLRSEIAYTVASPADVDDELRGLFAAIAA